MMQKKNYSTKKKGKTEVFPFWNLEDIKKMIDYFQSQEDWDNYLILMFGLLLGRRIGDTVMVKWSDFYYENGKRKEEVRTIEEQKTGKFTSIPTSDYVFECIDIYCSATGIDPMKYFNSYIFNYKPKNDWIQRQDNKIYQHNDIYEWCKWLDKDFSEKRINVILSEFEKQNEYNTLGEYLYYEVEYNDVVKWQTDKFRRAFKKAKDACKIDGQLSCHSLRKTLGYWLMMMHPDDPQALYIIQDIMHHSDPAITVKYIGMSEIRKMKYLNDFGDLLKNVANGSVDVVVNNSPIVSLRHEDLRKIIMTAIQSNKTNLETFDDAMSMVDALKVKYV